MSRSKQPPEDFPEGEPTLKAGPRSRREQERADEPAGRMVPTEPLPSRQPALPADWLRHTEVDREPPVVHDIGTAGPETHEPKNTRAEELETVVWQGTDPRLPDAPDVGKVVIAARYRVVAGLAKGGMARLYKVAHVSLGKEFALKILPRKTASDPQMRQKFIREARVSSQMEHPNIVQVIDFGVDPKHGAFIVMEYLKGETLRERLAREKRLREGAALDIVLQTAEALNYMHKQNIIHCDIKADNVFLCRPPPDQRQRRVVKLIDFGLSRSVAMGTTLARSEVGGTPQYVAPEQIQGMAPQPSMDIYSLGVLSYEMITGRQPFAGSASELLSAHQLEIPPPPSSVLGEPLDERVEAFILKALSKDPADRQPNMGQVIFELRTLMEMLGLARTRRQKAVFQSRPGRGLDQLRPIFDHCPCPLFRLDRDGKVLAANPAFCDFVRAKPVQVLGASIDQTRLKNIYPEIKADLRSAVEDGRSAPMHQVIAIPKGTGGELSVMIGLAPEQDDAGHVTHFTGVIHRLTGHF